MNQYSVQIFLLKIINLGEKNLIKNESFICNTLSKRDSEKEEIKKTKTKLFYPPIRKKLATNSNFNHAIRKAKKTKKKHTIKKFNFFQLPKSFIDNIQKEKIKSCSSKEAMNNNNNKDININEKLNTEKKQNENKKETKKLDAFELNELEYEEAIIQDKRTFIQTYLDLLCREHIIIFTFIMCNDYYLYKVSQIYFFIGK